MLTLRLELSVINEWLAANKLTLNVSKTKYVIFGKKGQTNTIDYNLSINNQKIQKVDCMKYLGVHLDEHLTFNNHISITHGKAVGKLWLLRRSREFLDEKSALTLYQSLLLPQSTYCDLVYETTTKANTEKLQKIQNSALRTILKVNKRTSVKLMHDRLKILTLSQRRDLNRAIDCYKHVTNQKSSLSFMFERSEHARQTRRSNELNVKVPNIRSEVGQKAYSYRGPVCWNAVNSDIKQAESKDAFKSAYTLYLLRGVNHPE